MRHVLLGAALLFATPAFACPMADAAAFADAAQKVQSMGGTHVTIAVTGMHCGDCSGKVTAKLQSIDGVKAAAADYQTGTTIVAIDGTKVKADALIAAIKELGYTATVATQG